MFTMKMSRDFTFALMTSYVMSPIIHMILEVYHRWTS